MGQTAHKKIIYVARLIIDQVCYNITRIVW